MQCIYYVRLKRMLYSYYNMQPVRWQVWATNMDLVAYCCYHLVAKPPI